MSKILLKNAKIVNENRVFESDVLLDGNYISRIDSAISDANAKVIDLNGPFVARHHRRSGAF